MPRVKGTGSLEGKKLFQFLLDFYTVSIKQAEHSKEFEFINSDMYVSKSM